MAELAPKERLQPSLLDRITDHEPEKSAESRERRVLSLRTLHQSVLRDLALLLNTTCLFRTGEITLSCPEVVNSVVNYGMPDIAGSSIAGIKMEALEKTIKQAIINFEPRLIEETVSVKAVSRIQEGAHYNKIAFDIQADMWALPYPERLYLKTELDTEGRGFKLTEMDRPG